MSQHPKELLLANPSSTQITANLSRYTFTLVLLVITGCGGGGGGNSSQDSGVKPSTVENNSIGIRLTVPSGSQATVSDTNIRVWASSVSLDATSDPAGPPSTFVTFDSNPSNLTMADYYNGSDGRPDLGPVSETISLTGRTATIFRPAESLSNDTVAIIPATGGFIVVLDRGAKVDAAGALRSLLDSLTFTK